ncbi:MAG TPA: FtsQ-type POTRA domain-containing protein [Stellaceae bacterium]|nr:FtsQ-type POTRA domain-containing protein [Stellaceae bacterium]
MRFLKRRDDPPAPRQRQGQPWSRRTILLSSAAAALAALALTGFVLERTGVIARAGIAVEQRLFAFTARCGLAIGNVQVEGRERTSREAVLNALAVTRGTPILAVDPADAKQRLETVPWIRSAAVERRFPDTLHIRLVERQPLAFWQRHGKLALIDRDGVVIPTERLDQFGNLIVLVGPDAPAHGAELIDMLATEPALAAHVAAAVRVGGRRWNLHLDNNIDIALPEDDAAAAWRRLAQLERSDGILEREIQEVDLRLPDRMVVRTVTEPPKPKGKKGRQGKAT